MKNYSFPILLLLFMVNFLFINKGYSQDIGLPSPTAANLGKLADDGINFFSGTPNIHIPITSIGGGAIGINISLSYDASGVRVGEIPDWVGAGWALNAGGVITRSVKGIPDEHINKGYLYNKNLMDFVEAKLEDGDYTASEASSEFNGKTFQNHLTDMRNGVTDHEPDVFYYNFDGQSGKFILGFDGDEPTTIPQSDFKIAYSTGVPADEVGGNTIIEFVISSADGTEYTFNKREYSLEQPGTELQTFAHATAWFLTKIKSPLTTDVITLNYRTQHEVAHKYNNEEGELTSSPTENRYTYQVHNRTNLHEIFFQNRKIVFNRALRTDAQTPSDWTPSNSSQEFRLTSIEEYHGTQKIKKFDFTYSYPGGRLFLDKIQETGLDGSTKPPYEFDYYNASNLPDRLNRGIDHWGYYNAEGSYNTLSRGFIQKGEWFNSFNNQYEIHNGAKREVNTTTSKYGVLNKITHPLGGTVEYEYEQNEYSYIIYENKTNMGLYEQPVSLQESKFLNNLANIEAESFDDEYVETLTVDVTLSYACNGTYLDNDRLYISDESGGMDNGWYSNRGYIDIDHTTNNNTTCTSFYNNYGTDWPNQMVNFTEEIYLNINFSPGNTFDFTFDSNLPGSYAEGDDTATLTYSVEGVEWVFQSGLKKKGPGLRVKRIVIKNGVSTSPDIIKEYKYVDKDMPSKSSGVIYNEPSYVRYLSDPFDTTGNPSAAISGLTIAQYYSFGMGAQGFSGYKRVEEVVTGKGNTEMQYYTEDNLTSYANSNLTDLINFYKLNLYYNSNVIISPYFGRPHIKTAYNESGVVLDKTIYTENQTDQNGISSLHDPIEYFGLAFDTKLAGVSSAPSLQPYFLKVPFLANTKTVKLKYDETSSETTIENFYNNNSSKAPTQVKETNSNGVSRTTDYEYAHQNHQPGMEALNMLTQPYSVTIKDGVADTVVSKTWTLWKEWENDQWLPCEKWAWNGGSVTPPANCSSN